MWNRGVVWSSVYFCDIFKKLGGTLHKVWVNAIFLSKIWIKVFILTFLMQNIIHIPIVKVSFRAVFLEMQPVC